MKAATTKQFGFLDPISGLALLAIFSLTGVAIESTQPADSVAAVETPYQVACTETGTAVVQEDFHCD